MQHEFQSYKPDKVLLEEVKLQCKQQEFALFQGYITPKKRKVKKILTSQKPKKAARQSTQSHMGADDRKLNQNKGKAIRAICLSKFYDLLLTVSHI